MAESTQTKRCSWCGESKPLSEFGINRSARDGLQYHCKPCMTEKRAQRTPEQVEARRRYDVDYMAKRRADPDMKAVLAARHQDWAKRNPERIRELAREYRQNNPDKFAAYREKHREAERARSSAWIKAHPEWNRERAHRRRALIRGSQTGPVDVEVLWTGFCGICGEVLDRDLRHPDPMSPTIDHIIALARGGSHTQDNLQWAHRTCNNRKYVNPP